MPSAAASGASGTEDFRAVDAIRETVPLRAHAQSRFGMVVTPRGDAAWTDVCSGGTTLTLFNRAAPGSRRTVPWAPLPATDDRANSMSARYLRCVSWDHPAAPSRRGRGGCIQCEGARRWTLA